MVFLLKKGDSGLVIDKRMFVVVVLLFVQKLWSVVLIVQHRHKETFMGAQAPGRRLVAFIFAPCRVKFWGSGFLKVNVADVRQCF